jgi:hypothetical protein
MQKLAVLVLYVHDAGYYGLAACPRAFRMCVGRLAGWVLPCWAAGRLSSRGLFSSRNFLGNVTVAISLLFDKYYPIMD